MYRYEEELGRDTTYERKIKLPLYFKVKAFEWLKARLSNFDNNKSDTREYVVCGTKARNRVNSFLAEQTFDEKTYLEFVELLPSAPYEYTIYGGKAINREGIVTSNLDNYIVNFNGFKVPLGFLKEYFEDDYDTNEENKKFYLNFLESCLSDFQAKANNSSSLSSPSKAFREIDRKKLSSESSNVFASGRQPFDKSISRFMMHCSNVIRCFLPFIILFISCYSLWVMIDIKDLSASGWNFVLMWIKMANVSKISFIINAAALIWNILFFLFPAFKLVHFGIRFTFAKLAVWRYSNCFKTYDKAVNIFSEYFRANNDSLAENPCIEKSFKIDYSGVPQIPIIKQIAVAVVYISHYINIAAYKFVTCYDREKFLNIGRYFKNNKKFSKINIVLGKENHKLALFMLILILISVYYVNTNSFIENIIRILPTLDTALV